MKRHSPSFLPSPVSMLLRAALIVGAGTWIYWPALHGGWLWDDTKLIGENSLIRDPSGWWKIWLQPSLLFDYFPLKVAVEWIEWRLFGDHTFGYHVVNLTLHLTNALLVWRLLARFPLRWAWLGGLIFAIHPVMVESVAWIAELKNTLSLTPFLLAMLFWIDYEENKRARDYGLSLGFFLIAMLCKTTLAMFPLVILLYAWWKRSRIGRSDLLAGAPFFAISIILGAVTLWFLKHHALGEETVPMGGALSRIACAGLAISFYLSKYAWPFALMPVYPRWPVDPPSLIQFWPWPVLIAAVGWFWKKRRGWGRHALLGFGFFILSLLPFLGFIGASYMVFTWVMDHLLYVPAIGLIGLTVAGIDFLDQRLHGSGRPFAAGFLAIVLAALAWGSHGYALLYSDSKTLWSYTLRLNPEAWPAYNNLAAALIQEKRFPEALEQYEKALRIKPDYVPLYNNIGFVFQQEGRYPEALEQYRKAVALQPAHAEAYNGIGYVLQLQGRPDEAMAQYEQALKINPRFALAHINLGSLLQQTGRAEEAIAQYQLALEIDSGHAPTHYNLGNALLGLHRLPEAKTEYETALQIDPRYFEAHSNLGITLAEMGQLAEAKSQFEEALRINPDYAPARDNLARVNALLTAPK